MTITINYYPKKNKEFSIGLGQDVGSLRSIIDILQIFIPNSNIQLQLFRRFEWRIKDKRLEKNFREKLSSFPVVLTVSDLTAEYRKNVGEPASIYAKSIIGALLDGQKWANDKDNNPILDSNFNRIKFPMRSWPMRNFIGMMIGMGLLDWNRRNGEVVLTQLGDSLALTQHGVGENLSSAEKKIFTIVFMSYPYTVGFLRALSMSNRPMTKFELGENFGFANEEGFTAYGERLYLKSMKEAYESGDKVLIKEMKNNWESTADKYMRNFASILGKLNLVRYSEKKIPYVTHHGISKTFSIPAYEMTGEGRKALGIAMGKSSHKRSKKNVSWDMLATKGEVVYIRTVRALILKSLSESKHLTAEQIADKVNNNKINEKHVLNRETVTADEVIDHIAGLNGIGLQIDLIHGYYQLKDNISDFEIPVNGNDLPKKSNVMRQQDEVRPYLRNLDHRYLQLIELALDSSKNDQYAQFESLTMELLFKQLNFNGLSMGGSSKPDGVAWDGEGNFIIIDTKAYSNGYSLANNTDKVFRYIDDIRKRNSTYSNKWWENVPESLNVVDDLRFVYVSGFFTGNYLKLLNDLRGRTNSKGGLVEVTKLLLTGELYLRRGATKHDALLNSWVDDRISFEEYSPILIEQLSCNLELNKI